jgi:predicted dehydrogenase
MSGDMTSNGGDWRIECEKGVIICEKEKIYTVRAGEFESGSYGGIRIEMAMKKMEHEMTAYLLMEFLQAIQHRRPPETNGEDNIKTLEMVFGAIASVEQKKRINLPE